MQTVRIGISTCPNDTFAFHALLDGRVAVDGVRFDIRLDDIQRLNEQMARGELDACKVSFAAALRLAGETIVLPSGAALGFGVGPLLLAHEPHRQLAGVGRTPPSVVLCPGRDTTAALLCELFLGPAVDVRHVVFSEIMPALARGEADYGVCIHEGRFTYQQYGLHLVADLGELWEEQTSLPLPLGGVVARRTLSPQVLGAISDAVRQSIEYAMEQRTETLPTMRRYAQELSDAVIWQHVDLYVNQHTIELGDIGRRALAELQRRCRDRGLIRAGAPMLEVLAAR